MTTPRCLPGRRPDAFRCARRRRSLETTCPNHMAHINHDVSAVQRKNCEPFVPGPALAIERMPGPSWRNLKFSSANFAP